MKHLIVHIGLGKTGSSALQSWLAVSQAQLASIGVAFHVTNPAALDYRVNAGNAGLFRELLAADALDSGRFLDSYFRGLDTAVISGEQLQMLEAPLVGRLHGWAAAAGIEVTVIGFIRNVYDMLYSTYLQSIKRGNQVKPFDVFVGKLRSYRHLDAVDRWSARFAPRWLHYDAQRGRLAEAFCAAAGLDASALPPMRGRRVNRSLSVDEAEVLKALVRWQIEAGLEPRADFSRLISDELVNRFPEEPVVFPFHPGAYEHMVRTFRPALERFNAGPGRSQGITLRIRGDHPYAPLRGAGALDRTVIGRIRAIIERQRGVFDAEALVVIDRHLVAAG